MRLINEIIIHCSATREGQAVSVATIRKWHLKRGFSDIGYHYIIGLNGKIHTGRDFSIAGAHAKGHNRNSVGICYVGGVDANLDPKDTRTPEQKNAICVLVRALKTAFPTIKKVSGHNQYAAKACPSFNVKEEF